ncbi:hypothetical protein AVEN_108431-1 [Araneus ventricosus]|uniref:Uncharacterized protein n=1 Tax=Araneus ventricosus TaxID=182803 RepID=A0A4Y2UU23_ARAVE|nr:hypothetical protein AVEN_108431-1 [Araneus ventricosus]
MEKDPLTPNRGRSYESIRKSLRKLREIPEHAEPSEPPTKQSKQWMKRRHSSEGSFIHITGTGTITEDALFCGKAKVVLGSDLAFEPLRAKVESCAPVELQCKHS